MQERNFYTFSAGVLSKLNQARRAAYREARTGYTPASSDAQALLLEVAERLKQRESWGDLTADQSRMLWSRFGLVQVYLSHVEGNGDPLTWQEWLNTVQGKEALARYPQRELRAARRESKASYEAYVDRRKAVKAARRAQPQGRATTGSHIVAQSVFSDPNEDALRNLCRLIKHEHGAEWSDKRPKGGTLKVAFMQTSGPTADRLRAAGFTFSPSVGWWRK